MPSVNVQFHMLPDELIQFVKEVSSRYQLEVELERFYPKALQTVPVDGDLTEEIEKLGQLDRIWLLCKTPKSKKAERFMLNVGRRRGNRLAQAQLGAGTNKAKAFEVLKKVAAELKRRTKAGIWLVTENGNVGYVKSARISEGATTAARAGQIDLVSPAFTQSYRVDPPESENS
ncbi:MAG TPA: hypothetical protein VG122_20230 [Gemmata sp.]|jgi:hypothetical protein|nr:hypothetical protein [Gemmata sp.]